MSYNEHLFARIMQFGKRGRHLFHSGEMMKNSNDAIMTNEVNETGTAVETNQRPMKDGVYIERRQGERRSGVERRDPNSRGASERRNPDRRKGGRRASDKE